MKLMTGLTVFALAMSLLSPASGQRIGIDDFSPEAITLNFDELPGATYSNSNFVGGTIINDHYQSLGLTFDHAIVYHAGPSYAISLPNTITSYDGQPIQIHFLQGASQAGIQIDKDGYDLDRQPRMRVLDTQGILLALQDFGQGPDFVGFSFPGKTIGTIQLESLFPNGQIGTSDGYDNLIFTPAAPQAVPEPRMMTFPVLGILIGFTMILHHRRRRAAEGLRKLIPLR